MPPGVNLHLLWPEFLVTALAFLVFGADFLLRGERKVWLGWATVLGLLLITGVTVGLLWGVQTDLYGGLLRIDPYALFFKVLLLPGAAVIALASLEFVQRYLPHPGEYYGILLFSVVAMLLLASAGEMLTAYVSLELLSFSLYTLAAYAREDPKSNEAGVKFILLGAFSSALLLYGLALLYGALGTTTLSGMAEALRAQEGVSPRLVAGLVFFLAGFAFKIAAVPFHMWAPDIYQGAPLPVTAYLATASKAAVFAFLVRLFAEGLLPAQEVWQLAIALLAAVTMTVGNLVAIAQRNLKRLLAYSSIGQMGYLLMGIAGLSPLAVSGLLLHLVGYVVTNLAAFLVLIAFYNREGKEDIPDLAGLADRSPFLAASLTAALFSLAGLPFLAGFATKFYLFTAVAREGFLWLAGLAVLNSLISLYYYLVVIRQMYIQPAPANPGPLALSPVLWGTIGVLVLGTAFIGVYPAPLVEAITGAIAPFWP